jgi:FMN phosphatase YigB (HAD superfamily)
VGDLYHADVVGARAAGIHAALLDPFGDWPDADCERLVDLTALVERLREARSQ